MAKKKISYAFSKGQISKENGEYILTETTKDSIESFNLSEILDGYIDVEGVTLSISSEDCVPVIEEIESED